jgi:hypothetical protein
MITLDQLFDRYGRSATDIDATEKYSKEEFREIWQKMSDWEQNYFIEIMHRPTVLSNLNDHGGRIVLSLRYFETTKRL